VGEVARTKSRPAKRSHSDGLRFGDRLIQIRRAAGYSQSELASELGISKRMMNYYEHKEEFPLAWLLLGLSRALGVTTDQLLGVSQVTARSKPTDTRAWRRLKQLEKLPREQRRHVLETIDAFVERQRLRARIPA
jgi:transcriptional regulator with XRE-family HTH domain